MAALKRVRTEQVQAEARRYSMAVLERMVSIALGDVQSNGKPPPVSEQLAAQKYVLERGVGKVPDVVALDVDVNVTQMSPQQLRDIVAGRALIEHEPALIEGG